MKLSDFILLGQEEKKQAVLHAGVLIGKIRNPDTMAFLFQIDNYYVEAFFNVQQRGIEEFRMFDHTDLLAPYLETIAIDDLLN
jgi:hypothetical protein